MKLTSRKTVVTVIFSTLCWFALGCSTFSRKQTAPPPEAQAAQTDAIQASLTEMTNRISELEKKLEMVHEKTEANRISLDMFVTTKGGRSAGIAPPPTEVRGVPVSQLQTESSGFENDESIQKFRSAMILFDGERYPEANVAFSAFLENFPDHVLAGSAQYYVGESYLRQGETKLALEEYRKVLISHDRSSYVTDALARMTECLGKLGNKQEAEKNKQLLLTLFPQAPAAAGLGESSNPAPAHEPTQTSPMIDEPPTIIDKPHAGLTILNDEAPDPEVH